LGLLGGQRVTVSIQARKQCDRFTATWLQPRSDRPYNLPKVARLFTTRQSPLTEIPNWATPDQNLCGQPSRVRGDALRVHQR
jgi:hypothetical protein